MSEVLVDDTAIDPEDYSLVGAVITLPEDTWMHGNDNVVVTYTSGWDVEAPITEPVPADIRLVALSAARRVFDSIGADSLSGAIAKETIGDYSYELSDAAAQAALGGGSELLVPEQAVLDRYRIDLVGPTPTV